MQETLPNEDVLNGESSKRLAPPMKMCTDATPGHCLDDSSHTWQYPQPQNKHP